MNAGAHGGFAVKELIQQNGFYMLIAQRPDREDDILGKRCGTFTERLGFVADPAFWRAGEGGQGKS